MSPFPIPCPEVIVSMIHSTIDRIIQSINNNFSFEIFFRIILESEKAETVHL